MLRLHCDCRLIHVCRLPSGMGPEPGLISLDMSGAKEARVAGSKQERVRDARVMGMNWTSPGRSARNLSTWQSFEVQAVLCILLRASGTAWWPDLAELCLNTRLLLLTQARSC